MERAPLASASGNLAEDHLRAYCCLLQGRPHKFHNLLARGSSPSLEPLTADEKKLVSRIKRYKAKRKQCYANCQWPVLRLDEESLLYCEGYVSIPKIGIATEHAWLTVNGKLFDPTPGFDGTDHYFGVSISREIVLAYILEKESHGPLLDDIELRWKYTKQILGDPETTR